MDTVLTSPPTEVLRKTSLPLEPTGQPSSAAELVQLGTTAYKAGNNLDAVRYLRSALTANPNLIDARIILIRLAMREKHLDEACALGEELERRASDNARAVATAAKAYGKARRLKDAQAAWRRVLELAPDDAGAWVELARTELRMKEFESAIASARRAQSLDAAKGGAYAVLIECFKRLRRLSDLAEVAIQGAPLEPDAAAAAIPLLIKSRPLESAEIAVAVRRNGGAIPPQIEQRLKRDLLRRGRSETEIHPPVSIRAWKLLLAIEPGSTQAASALRKHAAPLLVSARAKAAAGDIDGAIKDQTALLELGSDRIKTLRELAGLHEKAGHWPEAARLRAEAASVSDDPSGYAKAARDATKAGMLLEALDYYHKAFGESASTAEAQAAIHTVKVRLSKVMREHFDAGRIIEAARAAKVILATAPRDAPAAAMLRKAAGHVVRHIRRAVDEGDLEEQERLAKGLLEVDPDHSVGLRTLLRLYGIQKRRDEYLDVLGRLLEIEPDDSGHWEKKARICRSLRRYDIGIPAALRALELDPGNQTLVGYLNDMLGRQAAAA